MNQTAIGNFKVTQTNSEHEHIQWDPGRLHGRFASGADVRAACHTNRRRKHFKQNRGRCAREQTAKHKESGEQIQCRELDREWICPAMNPDAREKWLPAQNRS
jgi:hypothetical protein